MLEIKDNTVIKKMMLMSVTVLVTGVLLLAGFAKPALAWPPPCSGCCEWDGDSCEDDNDGCSSTQVCVSCTCEDLSVSLSVENNLTDCMEGRYVTFTATAYSNFPHGLLNPILFTFHFEDAHGTPWTAEDWSTDLVEDHTCVADDVLDGDGDHKFTTPAYVDAANDGKSVTSSTLNVDVYELWIDYFKDSASGKDWKVVVNKNIAYSGIAASGAKSWAWDTPDGVPDMWNPTGGNSKTGSGMVIPNSDLPTASHWNYFGDTYGTVKVFCEDAEGGNNTFYSTSMNPSKKVKVFFDKWGIGNPGGTSPNCFYYWVGTSADNGERSQTGGISYDASAPYMGYYNGNQLGTNPIYVCGNSTNERGHTNINEFSATTIHEGLHRDHDYERGIYTDTDGDWLIDTKETSDDLDLDGTRSYEPYTDQNTNGQYDPGEPFQDIGLTRLERPLGGSQSAVTYGDNNSQWDQEGANATNLNLSSAYHAYSLQVKGQSSYDDEDQTCYDIEVNAANATSEDWASPGYNWN